MSEQETQGVIVTRDMNGVAIPESVSRFTEYIQDRALREATITGHQLAVDQIARILQATEAGDAEALDEAMKFLGVMGLKEFESGTELEISAFRTAPGTREDFQNRFGVFAVLQATLLESGNTVFIDTGIERVITWLRGCEVLQRFPVRARVVKQQTGRGNDMITLLPLPNRVPGRKQGKTEPAAAES